jgi:hypothetical protein
VVTVAGLVVAPGRTPKAGIRDEAVGSAVAAVSVAIAPIVRFA